MTKTHNLIDIKAKPWHPESNGTVDRFNGAESCNDYGGNYLQGGRDHREARAAL